MKEAMAVAADAFLFHPDLREKISDPLTSFSRRLTTEMVAELAAARGLPSGWWYPDEEREAERIGLLAGCRAADLWVFGYGSLMSDPGMRFEEVRREIISGRGRSCGRCGRCRSGGGSSFSRKAA